MAWFLLGGGGGHSQQDGCTGLSPWDGDWQAATVQLRFTRLPVARALPAPGTSTHCISFGLELSCPGKVDSEVMTLNAPQLDSNFKKLHSLRVEMKEKLPSRN